MEQLVLGRVGHYHVPGTGDGACQVAIVAFVRDNRVNVAGFEHDGEPFRHLEVPVVPADALSTASFHLTRDCPFGR